MKLNTRLLPVKASYFFTLAAVASLLPYLSIYLKQVGLTPIEAAITYGLMPFIGAIVRPLLGALADKLHMHKLSLMLCCIFSGIFFAGLLFIPHSISETPTNQTYPVSFVCDGSSKYIEYCATSSNIDDICLSNETELSYSSTNNAILNSTQNCHLRCNHTSTLRQAICADLNSESACMTVSNVSSDPLQDLVIDIRLFASVEFSKTENPSQVCTAFHFNELSIENVTLKDLECPDSLKESCAISCEHGPKTCDSDPEIADSSTTFGMTFWYCFIFLLGANIAFAPIFSLIDAMTYDYLGDDRGNWGKQRVWGTFGFAVFAVISGLSMDMFSDSSSGDKDYTVAFVLYALLSFIAAVAVWFYKISPELTCSSVLRNVGQVLKQLRAISLFVLVFIFGMYTGLIETFLYWHLSTLDATQLLFGLCMLVNCIPEIPILFLAGRIIEKLGHVNMFYITLIAYAIRLIAYSFLVNPWMVLIIEPLHGVTFGLMYAAASSYASVITPPGMHGVMQGLIGGIHFGLGKVLLYF